ncbi:MAG: 2-amino-4-hydroxy-6-hydroxymethyldihydropteridine diphosphokinase [Xanthobacteraceae bacterium]|jgi:2-amino-4-hydroxy-6-hydroxymethyldihydropteridine diphosphokinase
MPDALIGLGGNIGDARKTIEQAIALLCDGPDVRLLARSFDYRTRPWGIEDQPHFINACIELETKIGPHTLFRRCQNIENVLGRDRTAERQWGPRRIDIDLLAYDDVLLTTPELTLPHPRLFERAFALVPLAEIVPERMIAGRRVRDAVREVDTRGIDRLPPRQHS